MNTIACIMKMLGYDHLMTLIHFFSSSQYTGIVFHTLRFTFSSSVNILFLYSMTTTMWFSSPVNVDYQDVAAVYAIDFWARDRDHQKKQDIKCATT